MSILPQFDVNAFVDYREGEDVARALINEGLNPLFWGDREIPPAYYQDRSNVICMVKEEHELKGFYSGTWIGNQKPILLMTFDEPLTDLAVGYWIKLIEPFFENNPKFQNDADKLPLREIIFKEKKDKQ
jgi:hypothetical protein